MRGVLIIKILPPNWKPIHWCGSLPFLLALLILVTSAAPAATAGTREKPEKLSHKKLTELLDTLEKQVYYGGCMIPKGDTLGGLVVVVAGALDIQDEGVLLGDAWVINGKLILNGSALIDGSVKMVNSSDYLSHDARITGDVEYYRCECRLDDETFESDGEVVFLKHEDPTAVKTKLAIKSGSPSRVDYEIVRLGLERRNDRHEEPYIRGHALLHVPIWKESGGHCGFDIDIAVPLGGEKLTLLIRGFKQTETNDAWMVSRLENGLIVLCSGDDFSDYWERRGGELGLQCRPSETLELAALLSMQEDVSLEAMSIPSLFYSKDKYRENPAIDDGDRLALAFRIMHDSREDEAWRKNAWLLGLWIEKGFSDGWGEFSYTAFDIDINRYNYLPRGMTLDLRAKLFSSFDSVPKQISRSLNGYGGIRGARDIPFEVQRGDRLVLFSVEVRKRLPDLWLIKSLFSYWDLLLFSDIGLLAEAENKTAPLDFLEAPFDEWKKTAGVGISGASFLPYIGLYMAQDLDSESFSPRVILRLERSF